MRTAEELRIKGLAEVSWNDENGDGKQRNKSKTPRHATEPATTVKLHNNQSKRHSISSSHNHLNSNEIDPLADHTSVAAQPPPPPPSSNHGHRDVDDTVQVTKTSLMLPIHTPPREEQLPPVKKKRGRPPLDDDFDSYSTPKISHVESTANSYETNLEQHYDDNSHDPISRPSSILEQSMEVSMTCDEPNAMPIQPKIERPDTPASRQDYYDDYNPQSPMDESTDAGLTSQVINSNEIKKRKNTENSYYFRLC